MADRHDANRSRIYTFILIVLAPYARDFSRLGHPTLVSHLQLPWNEQIADGFMGTRALLFCGELARGSASNQRVRARTGHEGK